jgi:hypothetical protein
VGSAERVARAEGEAPLDEGKIIDEKTLWGSILGTASGYSSPQPSALVELAFAQLAELDIDNPEVGKAED